MRNGNALDSFSGGFPFEYQLEHPYSYKFFMVFLRLRRQTLGYYIKWTTISPF
jgi:hypothetical protein